MNFYTKVALWIIGAAACVLVAATWTNHRIESAQKDLENAALKRKLEQARLPEVQVQVSMRKGLIASGNVAGFRNTSDQIIAITAEVERPTSGLKKAFAITLDPHQTKELGGLEGWEFVPGDTIHITQAGHKPTIVTTQ